VQPVVNSTWQHRFDSEVIYAIGIYETLMLG